MQIMLMALRGVCSQLRVALGIASCFSWSMSQSSELRAGSWQLAAGSWQLAALLLSYCCSRPDFPKQGCTQYAGGASD
jgi:hypothetical protein